MNYIKNILKSLKSLTIRDFLFIGVIIFLLFKVQWCNPPHSRDVKLPELTKVEKVIAKDGTTQSVIQQIVLSKAEMKESTKSITHNLNNSSTSNVTQVVTKLDLTTEDIPTTLDELNHVITDTYKTKDIVISHTYNLDSKMGKFDVHLTPDTVTIVNGIKTHWFRPNEYNVHINHTNELFNDTLGSSYTFKESKPWLVIGPSIGVGVKYDNKFSVYPTIGITATIPLISIKRK